MVLKQMPDVLCPRCLDKGGLEVTKKLKAKPLGGFSLAGGQLKFSAVEKPYLRCSLCEWEVEGEWVDHGDVIFPDPHE